MRIQDLPGKMTEEQKFAFLALWPHRLQQPYMDELFKLWEDLTGDKRWRSGCGKCRSETMVKIQKLINLIK